MTGAWTLTDEGEFILNESFKPQLRSNEATSAAGKFDEPSKAFVLADSVPQFELFSDIYGDVPNLSLFLIAIDDSRDEPNADVFDYAKGFRNMRYTKLVNAGRLSRSAR